MRIALLDYGAGNLHSLQKAIVRHGAAVEITRDWGQALHADALVLPGVGSFQSAVRSLPADVTPVRAALSAGFPCLGICLGMQLLFDASEEGAGHGLGLIPGTVRRLRAEIVPQMGWNDVRADPDPLFPDPSPLVAYYANSYVCEPEDPRCVVAWSEYEGDRFAAAVRHARTWGVQFHPEKSSRSGLALIERFLEEAR
ncbi:MAG: imidazole glycerol phosphate synthase subunit HisH [Gemmatimonadota bacterium]